MVYVDYEELKPNTEYTLYNIDTKSKSKGRFLETITHEKYGRLVGVEVKFKTGATILSVDPNDYKFCDSKRNKTGQDCYEPPTEDNLSALYLLRRAQEKERKAARAARQVAGPRMHARHMSESASESESRSNNNNAKAQKPVEIIGSRTRNTFKHPKLPPNVAKKLENYSKGFKNLEHQEIVKKFIRPVAKKQKGTTKHVSKKKSGSKRIGKSLSNRVKASRKSKFSKRRHVVHTVRNTDMNLEPVAEEDPFAGYDEENFYK
jgi:hypothetical protein